MVEVRSRVGGGEGVIRLAWWENETGSEGESRRRGRQSARDKREAENKVTYARLSDDQVRRVKKGRRRRTKERCEYGK